MSLPSIVITNTQAVWLGVLIVTGIIAGLGDYITTVEGKDIGFTEWNWLAAKLQAKLGMAGACAAALAFFVWSAGLIGSVIPWMGLTLAATVTGVEIFNTVRNYIITHRK